MKIKRRCAVCNRPMKLSKHAKRFPISLSPTTLIHKTICPQCAGQRWRFDEYGRPHQIVKEDFIRLIAYGDQDVW